MDDSCAVCAETLQWVAYGPCGHREVCSTCVVRLRFICEDYHCCLCKGESKIIFVTKALGDYTRMINDFAIFPAEPTEGQVGKYWYHEGTQAYFDDFDQYKMIKSMCRLSCSVCNNEERSERTKRKGEFKNIEQLKGHLIHRHKLFMCSLCLESRKVFMCEQKLYNKAQLNQHIKTGDSEVDGSETERGGFMGHPMCQFCQSPFYGENELYSHMSTEHYTCHICQRRHPGQYEYYKNYDDLEIHFRRAHFFCEDEGCLAIKFVVFATESELKRHNAREHGGQMSRSKRNAALQIPVSFQHRRSNHQHRHGFPSQLADNQLSVAIQASLETANAERSRDTSSSSGAVSDQRERNELESTNREYEPSSRLSHAARQNSSTAPLEDSSFPPLPVVPRRRQQKIRSGLERLGGNTIASRLHHHNNAIRNSSQAWPMANRSQNILASSSHEQRPISNSALLSSSSASSFVQSRLATRNGHSTPYFESSVSVTEVKSQQSVHSSFASSSRNSTSTSTAASSPILEGIRSFNNSVSNFPPVSAARIVKAPTSSQSQPKAEDAKTANKSLVERIQVALDNDDNKFAVFKEISAQYRLGLINTEEYLAHVFQFDLSHLILEIARLCPDLDKQRELIETYNFNTRSSGSHENSLMNGSARSRNKKSSKKGKEKCEDNETDTSKDVMKKLESNKHPVDRVENLLENGNSSAKGKSKIVVDDKQSYLDSTAELQMEWKSQTGNQLTGDGSKKNSENGVGNSNKQRKKTPKFLRNRLGDEAAALIEPSNSDIEEKIDKDKDPPEGLPVGGVWRNGGGRRLVATVNDPKKR
ncbi:hypothetical protein UlMin_015159 [Ulmus minor]